MARKQREITKQLKNSTSRKEVSKVEIERRSLLVKGEEISFRIPEELAREFGKDLRIVIRHPWVVGIPVPERLLKPELVKGLQGFEVIITPNQLQR